MDIIADDVVSHGANFIPMLLFTLETYHAIAHACILFRVRMLPKRDLVRLRYYFLIDLVTVSSSALFTREFLWIAALQNLQHLYFFATWNKASYCIRVINWSSLDWVWKPRKSTSSVSEVDVSLGTAFDMAVHILYAYCLAKYLAFMEFFIIAVLLLVLLRALLFNGNFAWSNPKSVPEWVGKRVYNSG